MKKIALLLVMTSNLLIAQVEPCKALYTCTSLDDYIEMEFNNDSLFMSEDDNSIIKDMSPYTSGPMAHCSFIDNDPATHQLNCWGYFGSFAHGAFEVLGDIIIAKGKVCGDESFFIRTNIHHGRKDKDDFDLFNCVMTRRIK